MTTALEIERRILLWLSDIVGPSFTQTIDPQVSFFAYGMDSLAMVALGAQLSELLGTTVSVDAIFDHATPRELAEFLAGPSPPEMSSVEP
jgi:acyl carrier protein